MNTLTLEKLYDKIGASANNNSVGGGEALRVADAQTAILINELDFSDAKSVLDFGCGIGRTMPLLFSKLSRDDLKLDGCDISAEFVRECKALYRDYPFRFFKIYAENSHYSKYDVSSEDENVPVEYYDIAYSFSVFTHLDLEKSLDALRRVNKCLKPGATYYFTMFRLDDGSIEAINSGRKLPFGFSKKVKEGDAEFFANDADPLAFAAMKKGAVEDIIRECGFEPTNFIAGGWRGIAAANIHDAYIVAKK